MHLLPREQVDNSYVKQTFVWSGGFAGETSTAYIKLFEQDGKIAVCGARSNMSGIAGDLLERWFDNAYVVSGYSRTRIVTASFIIDFEPDTPRDQITASCMLTNTHAEMELLASSVTIRGGTVRGEY